MMLAEISNGEWAMIIINAAIGIIALIALMKKTDVKVSPQPLEVKEAASFVHRHEFEKHIETNSQTHRDIFSKIGGVERGASGAIERQVEVVRKDLVIVSNQVAGLKAQTDLQNKQLERIEKTVSDLPGKIVADIVNSKKL
jgi:hypothetical protein